MAAFTPTFLYLTGGLVIWAVRFLAIYSLTGLACARGWVDPAGGFGALQIVVVLLSIVALAGCAAILLRAGAHVRDPSPDEAEENDRFIHYVAGSVAALAALAIVYEGLPFFLIPVCE
jgi:hypothetical protein